MSSLNDFKFGKLLGKGAYSTVYLVHRIIDGQIYAMKQVRINQLSEKEKKNSLNEIRILASLSHKNIIGYKDAFFDENSKTLNIVMEYADNGDISQKIKYNLKHGLIFRENIIWNYLIQTLEGLHYLHNHNIIHRDLKSANIFLTNDGTIKIGDLNVSKIQKMGMAYTQTGTPYYASPEIWLDKPYDFKSDIWSLGCILYELCQLKPPFRGTSLKNLCFNIQRGIYEPIMSFYSEELKHIIDLMLRTDPKIRPTTGQILKSRLIMLKKKELKLDEELDRLEMEKYDKKELIGTIKIPRNLKEINGNLPTNKYNKNKTKNNEEMMKEDEYETNKRLKGFLNDEDKKEIQKIYGNNNINYLDYNKNGNMKINNSGKYKNGNNINDMNNKYKNYNNIYQFNNYNSDNYRMNNLIRDKQKYINKNINNSNRIYLNDDLKSVQQKLDNIKNKDDLISLDQDFIKNRKKISTNKYKRNMSDIEDNNNYIYKKYKTKEKKKYENIDDYLSQNINIYNNINKYYYKNYFDLMSYNGNKMSKKPMINNINNNLPKKLSNIELLKNKINSDKSPSKYNYIFNKGNHFNNIKPENKLNNSTNNEDTHNYYNKNKNFIMNNNFNPNININIFNNREDKKPNFNNIDYVDNININDQFKFDITPEKQKDKHNINSLLDINLLESSNKKEKESWYIMNDINANCNKIKEVKSKKGYFDKLKTENNDFVNPKKRIRLEFNANIKQSDTESLNSQIFKLNKKDEINIKNMQHKNFNNQGKIVSSKTPILKNPKKNNKRKKLLDNNQLSSKEDMSDNYSNILLSNKNNIKYKNSSNNNNAIKKPKLLLNLDNYQPKVYVGINNKYRNEKNFNNNYIPYPSSEYRYDNIISNKLKSNGLYLENNNINNRNNNVIGKIMPKNKSEYLKDMNNNLINLNEKDNFIFNNNNYNIYKKQNNYRMTNNENINRSKKRPVSSIVQRKIEKSNRYNKLEPSFNNKINRINNNIKFDDSLDQLNNINDFYSNKGKVITEANNMNNIRLNNLNYINNNKDLMNYRNKVKKNKLEIINNFNNYKDNRNKIKNDFRKIDIQHNKPEKYRNINKYNNQRVITPSSDNYNKKLDENGKITDKYRLKRLNGKIGESYSNISNFNESNSQIQKNNNYKNINKIEVQMQPKRKGKIIIEKYNYQPIKKRNSNKNNNNIINYNNYFIDEYNNMNNKKIFENYNQKDNNIYNMNNIYNNNNYINDNNFNGNLFQNQINYLNYNDYNNYNFMNGINNSNKKINNIYNQPKENNNFLFDLDLIKNNRNYKRYKDMLLKDKVCYSVGNNENSNSFRNYLDNDFNI